MNLRPPTSSNVYRLAPPRSRAVIASLQRSHRPAHPAISNKLPIPSSSTATCGSTDVNAHVGVAGRIPDFRQCATARQGVAAGQVPAGVGCSVMATGPTRGTCSPRGIASVACGGRTTGDLDPGGIRPGARPRGQSRQQSVRCSTPRLRPGVPASHTPGRSDLCLSCLPRAGCGGEAGGCRPRQPDASRCRDREQPGLSLRLQRQEQVGKERLQAAGASQGEVVPVRIQTFAVHHDPATAGVIQQERGGVGERH